MNLFRNKIVVIGGSGRFGKVLKKNKYKYNLLYPNKNKLNILKQSSIVKYLKVHKPKYVLHLAGLSRPMSIHETNLKKSIDLNIIGTSNVTKACSDFKIKLIYFSTSYVYPGKKGNYKETDSVLPINKYAWSKLGGECAVRLYSNSLILRVSMTERPFVHKKAFTDFITNFIFHDEVAKILFKLINKKGIINLGGKSQSVYNFVKKFNPKIKKASSKNVFLNKHALNTSMNIRLLKSIVKKTI